MEWKMLGVEVVAEDDLVQPLEVAAVVKGIDSDGDVGYWCIKSPDIQNVEVLGMMTWGAHVALTADED